MVVVVVVVMVIVVCVSKLVGNKALCDGRNFDGNNGKNGEGDDEGCQGNCIGYHGRYQHEFSQILRIAVSEVLCGWMVVVVGSRGKNNEWWRGEGCGGGGGLLIVVLNRSAYATARYPVFSGARARARVCMS